MTQSGLEPFPRYQILASLSTGNPIRSKPVTLRRGKSSGIRSGLPGESDAAAITTLSSPSTSSTHTRNISDKPAHRLKRRTVKSTFSKWKCISLRYTWLNPLIICLIVISLYLVNPSSSNPAAAALFLSYALPREPGSDAPIQYGKGARDFAFVGFYTIALSFTREFLMQCVIRPIALKCRIRSRHKQSRFMEQFYTAIYLGIAGPFGLWVMSGTPVWYFNTMAMYSGFPHRTHEAVFKVYYLVQASYWAQQMLVLLLGLEKPRKDYKELVAHHFITLSLIWLSYRFHFTYMGIAVYVTHDISDFFIVTSKILSYLDSILVGPYYFTFLCIWAYLRHYLNLKILYSVLTEFPTVGPFELNWETQQYKCWISQAITFALLAALQALNLFWFFLLCRMGYRFVASWGQVAEDERSEYEDSEEEIEDEKKSGKTGGDTASGAAGALKLDGAAAKANGEANGMPKVMLNGKPVPRTPSPAMANAGE
ncbi:longevity assurance proteins LAG1/LAC1 [Zopfia rhizophila CBS 207.26]|uniref:Longevity assurance proteins LAG1/LAC1 n=1 Tax=Zopfia rhizophila CBS 207.26 TaxID=1314779 RepID=A0A6A6DMW8_9PEZI|nr:longevity assurance proteins LAG1/LAC1 [Zopfia rhizophila CBS 207.26]